MTNARPTTIARLHGALLYALAGAACAQGAPGDITADVPAPVDVAVVSPPFDILEFRVEGNTLLTRRQLEDAVSPFMGERRAIADVKAARVKLEAAYHEAGWLTVQVDIPEQAVTSGVVTLKVGEAPIGQVRITGSRYYTHGMIRSTVPSLNEGRVPNFNTVQKEMAQLNRSASRRVRPLLRPSDTPGMVDVELQVADQSPLRGGIEVNNRHSIGTSSSRLQGYLRYDNLFQRDHSLMLYYLVAPENVGDVRALSVAYTIPTAAGPSWAFYAVRARSDIATIGSLNVIGNGQLFGARRIAPLPAVGRFSHSWTLGIDYKDFGDELRFRQFGTFPRNVTYMPLSAQYNATWSGGAESRPDTTSLEAGAHVLAVGMRSEQAEFDNRRKGAEPTYMILRGGLSRDQALGARASLLAKADVQLASGPLVSAEQFTGGGADNGRGYREIECLGDLGSRGSVEARLPVGAGQGAGADAPSLVRTFFEAARLQTLQPLPGAASHCSLASVGIGLRHTVAGLRLNVDVAQALQSTANTRSGDVRLHVRANYDF